MKVNWLQERHVLSGCGIDDGTNVTDLMNCKRMVNDGENGMMMERNMIPGSVGDFYLVESTPSLYYHRCGCCCCWSDIEQEMPGNGV